MLDLTLKNKQSSLFKTLNTSSETRSPSCRVIVEEVVISGVNSLIAAVSKLNLSFAASASSNVFAQTNPL